MADAPEQSVAPAPSAPKADPAQTHVVTQWKHGSPFISCRFDPTGKYVFATAEDRSIQRWTIADGKQIGFAGHDSWVRGLAFSRDGQTLVTGGFDGRLIWWPAADDTPKPIRTIEAHDGWIRYLAVSPDGKLLASAGNDHLLKIWKLDDGSKVAEFTGHDAHVYSCAFHPQGKLILSGDLQGKVIEHEVESGKLTRTFDASSLHSYNGGQQVDFGGVRDLAFSSDGKQLACAGLHKAENPLGAVSEPLVLLFDFESQKLLQSLTNDVKGVVWRTVFHPDGFILGAAGGSGGGWLHFWKPDAPAVFHRFQLPNTVRDMDLHPDGLQIVTAHHDKQVRISRLVK